nr:DUF1294 domain-containing protein [Zobellella endophytica]
MLFFALVLIALAWLGVTSWWPPAWYLGLSLAAYLAYALDKQAARQDQWRTKESTLHLLALFGGWPGALVAQHRLRHKSRKTSFRVVFWLTVALNLLALAWLLSAPGARMLQSLPLLNG